VSKPRGICKATGDRKGKRKTKLKKESCRDESGNHVAEVSNVGMV
jgi:hypothetical protein